MAGGTTDFHGDPLLSVMVIHQGQSFSIVHCSSIRSLSLKSVEATFDGDTFKQLASLPGAECDACLVEVDEHTLLHIGGFINGSAVYKYRWTIQ